MQKTSKQAEQKPLVLKGWIYCKDGKQFKELVKISFLEFYFTKYSTDSHQKAC